jgi:hypothetical protein
MAYAAFSTAYTPEPTRCAGGVKPGTRILQDWICDESPWAASFYDLGTYVCRTIAGSSKLSSHASGRAGDSGCKVDPAPNPAGTALANWLVANAPILGVQECIWNRRRWDNQSGWDSYGGVSPHLDHVHWSLNTSGGTYLTRERILSVAPSEDDEMNDADRQWIAAQFDQHRKWVRAELGSEQGKSLYEKIRANADTLRDSLANLIRGG